MSKPIKPSKNLVYCYACKRRKMLFEEKSEADNFIKYNHGGILEENGKHQFGVTIVNSAVVIMSPVILQS